MLSGPRYDMVETGETLVVTLAASRLAVATAAGLLLLMVTAGLTLMFAPSVPVPVVVLLAALWIGGELTGWWRRQRFEFDRSRHEVRRNGRRLFSTEELARVVCGVTPDAANRAWVGLRTRGGHFVLVGRDALGAEMRTLSEAIARHIGSKVERVSGRRPR